jgi:hydrogenase maturation protease
MMTVDLGYSTLVLGLGNPLMGDDGFGLAVLERMRQRSDVPRSASLVDGGTWGMNLLPEIERADRLLLLDAVNAGKRPGSIIRLERNELPRWLSLKVSPHQVDLREVLALAELRGSLPQDTIAIGVQPFRVEMHLGLSPLVASRVEDVTDLAIRQLLAWDRLPAAAHA